MSALQQLRTMTTIVADTGDLAAIAGDQLDIVDRSSERHGAEWHRVTHLGCHVGARDHGGADRVGHVAVDDLARSGGGAAVRC